jgi:hypothetical protein
MEELDINVNDTTLEGFTSNPEVDTFFDEEEEETTEVATEVATEVETSQDEPKVIGTINSASYGGLTKILSLLTTNSGKSDIISIEKGKLSTIYSGGFLYCDLSILFGENNFDIIDPQYSIKLMKLISGGDEVVFVEDDAKSRYLISNLVDGHPQININLPKPDPSLNSKITKPNIGELQENLEDMNPDLAVTISTAEKNLDSQYFILEVNKNSDTNKTEIISISTDKETFKYNFKDSLIGDSDQETSSYKLFNPFPVPKPDEIEFKLFETEAGDLWIQTISEVGLAKIEYMEKLAPMGLFDTYTL